MTCPWMTTVTATLCQAPIMYQTQGWGLYKFSLFILTTQRGGHYYPQTAADGMEGKTG